MERILIPMDDPTFAPGSAKTARATLTVKPAGMACTFELWLSKDGTSKDATSGAIPFTSTGADQNINLPVTMPAGGYAYQVLLDVKTGGMVIGAYRATEDVLVPFAGIPVITW